MTDDATHRCSKCKEVKPKHQFHKSNTHSAGVQRYCKGCKKKIDSKGHGKYKGKYAVYYLPKHNYIGMSKNLTKRMQKHRKRGKNTTGFRVLIATKNAKLAHTIESLFHILGFKGFRY
tara:strand:- start:1345 stop:1698 length:354 start_codon:yes stop_codon:yes gene_type:complete